MGLRGTARCQVVLPADPCHRALFAQRCCNTSAKTDQRTSANWYRLWRGALPSSESARWNQLHYVTKSVRERSQQTLVTGGKQLGRIYKGCRVAAVALFGGSLRGRLIRGVDH